MNNPYDVEWGYDSMRDSRYEFEKHIENTVDDKIDLFLYDIQTMFEKHGVTCFHKYDGYDFEYSLDTLRDELKKRVESQARFRNGFDD